METLRTNQRERNGLYLPFRSKIETLDALKLHVWPLHSFLHTGFPKLLVFGFRLSRSGVGRPFFQAIHDLEGELVERQPHLRQHRRESLFCEIESE